VPAYDMTQITVTQQAGGTFRVQTLAGTSHEVSVLGLRDRTRPRLEPCSHC
jgi:hypothetical protein